ncbi:MAG: hypothetical protein QNL88_08985 [Acidobacteriota bacterium]|nr:hypothetical protein [Acidobacteriota bacterium]
MNKPKEPKKRPYEKPQLRRIGLVADEVLAAGCKLGNQAGPRGANCRGIPCSKPGS